jgi:hypothetical protein
MSIDLDYDDDAMVWEEIRANSTAFDHLCLNCTHELAEVVDLKGAGAIIGQNTVFNKISIRHLQRKRKSQRSIEQWDDFFVCVSKSESIKSVWSFMTAS